MATQTISGILEIDADRGVIYFHSDEGTTKLRISGLPKPIDPAEYMLDIGVNYSNGRVITNWKGT